MYDLIREIVTYNPCLKCDYYCIDNNTCQLKKCSTFGDGTVTLVDRVSCQSYKNTKELNSND